MEEVISQLIGEHIIPFPRYGTCITLRLKECNTTDAELIFSGDHKMLASAPSL
jgi:hypothetical protein